jgi:hypothetical protein
MSDNVPLTYASVTAGDRKRRVLSRESNYPCPYCFTPTHIVMEQYRAVRRWHNGRVVGEKCKRCGWGFDYDTEEAS